MKKIIAVFMLSLIIFSFVSCKSNSPAETVQPSPTQSKEIATPTPTPIPTLSEQDKVVLTEYNKLFSYCKSYNDWYAVLLLKGMLDEEKITSKQFAAIFDIETFQKAKDFDESTWADIQSQLTSIKDIINGQSKNLKESDMDIFYNYLCSASKQNTVFIAMFDSPEATGRLANAITDINKWFNTPNEDNFKLVEKAFLLEDVTPGEIMILSCYLFNSPELPDMISTEDGDLESSVFLSDHNITIYSNQAYEKLFDLNQ